MKNIDFIGIMTEETETCSPDVHAEFERSIRKIAKHLVLGMEGAIRLGDVKRSKAIKILNGALEQEYKRVKNMDEEDVFHEMFCELPLVFQTEVLREAFGDDE